MLPDKQLTHLSRFLSLVLRHKPETIGIELDNNGWTDIGILIEKFKDHGTEINLEILNHIVATNTKKRFAFDVTGTKIRASQGHSVGIDPGYTTEKPPELLFHGTAEKSVTSILEHGLYKQKRQHVHLSMDREVAKAVGQRHGKPVVLRVLSGKMFSDNFTFYLSDNGVWLTDHVPAEYLELL